MADSNQIGLEAIFEDSEFQKGIADYNSAISDSSSQTETAGSTMSAVWSGLSSIGAIAFSAVGAAISAMTGELYLAVDAALETQDVMARMEFIVGNVAERTGVTSDDVLKLADSMSQVVPIDDEVITQAITMGLTFDGVNKDNIQPLISASADLATLTGKDLPSTMKELSLAISDPDKAMRLFRDANITLSEEQKKTLKNLADTGDTAGATTFILDQLSQKGIIGLGEAMGNTAKGKMTIMMTAIGNLQEALGSGLLDSLAGVFDKITEFASDPKTVAFFTDLGTRVGNFAETIISRLPSVLSVIDDLSTWFSENKPLIVGVLAAIGVAMLAFAATAIETAIAVISGLAPILLAMAAIGAIAALLYTAWTEDWGGIQEKTAEVGAVLKPIFDALVTWLSVNIPIAIAALSDFWTNTLLPAIQTVFEWIVTNLIPLFISVVEWLTVNVPLAISTLSGFWTGTLLPAIQAVWGWISANLIPLFISVANLIGTVLSVAITALAGLWQNVLYPALLTVGNFISANITPIFLALSDIVTSTLLPALKPLADFLSNVLVAAFNGITSAIQTLIGWIDDLTSAFANVELPPALTPGSPTPFEIGLKGINEQLGQLAKTSLPAVSQQMNVLATVRDVPSANATASSASIISSSSSTRNYLFGAQFSVNNSAGLFDILNGLK